MKKNTLYDRLGVATTATLAKSSGTVDAGGSTSLKRL